MGGSASTVAAKDTKFYDLLGVQPDVSVAELNKAYKKKALRLHPDKGGDPEEFKKMKDAYDVLSNPEKRKLYDKYGPELMNILSGEAPPSMEAVVAIVANVTQRERITAACVVVCSAVVALSPVTTLSLRWDGTSSIPWVAAFVPFWLIEAVLVCVIVMRSTLPEPEEELDDESRREFEEMKRGFRAIKAFGACALVLAAAQQALVAARLQGLLACSWVLVWSPWLLVELGLLLRAAASAPAEWAAEAPPKSLPRFAMRVFGCCLARLATAVLAAARAQELVTCSWLWCLLPPLLVAAAGACCSRAASEPSPARPPWSVDMRVQLQSIQARPELNGREARLEKFLQESGRWTVELDDGSKISLKPECLQPLESAEDELPGRPSAGRVLCWLPWLALAALKLDGHGLSAFLVFLPVFVAVCCTTCFFSCSFLCITAEMVEESFAAQEEQAGQPGPAEAQAHYERMA